MVELNEPSFLDGLMGPGLMDSIKERVGGLNENPLFHLGVGLLQSGGPSARPMGIGDGLAMGLQSLGKSRETALRRAALQESINDRKAKREREQSALEAAQDERVREAERQRQIRQALGNAGVDQIFASDPSKALDLLARIKHPEAPKPTAGLQEYQAAVEQGFNGSFLDYKKSLAAAGRSSVTVNNNSGGGLAVRPLTEDEAVKLGIPVESKDEFVVDSKGGLKERPLTRVEKAEAVSSGEAGSLRKSLRSLSNVENSLDTYRKLINEHGTEFLGATAAELDAARTGLLVEAKNLFQLGALSGPDFELMESTIGDSTSLLSNMEDVVTGGGRTKGLKKQLDLISGKLADARKTLETDLSKATGAKKGNASASNGETVGRFKILSVD